VEIMKVCAGVPVMYKIFDFVMLIHGFEWQALIWCFSIEYNQSLLSVTCSLRSGYHLQRYSMLCVGGGVAWASRSAGFMSLNWQGHDGQRYGANQALGPGALFTFTGQISVQI